MSCISCLWLRRLSSCVERCSFTGAQKQKLSMASAPRREEWNVWWTCSPAASDAAESTQGGTCSGLGCSLWANPELLPPWVHPGLQTLPNLEAPLRTCMPKQDVRPGGCWSPHKGRPALPSLMPWSRPQPFPPSSHFSYLDYSPQDSDGPQALPFKQAQGNPGWMPSMLAAQAGTHKGCQVVRQASRWPITQGAARGSRGLRGRQATRTAPFRPLRQLHRGDSVQPGLFQLFLQSPCKKTRLKVLLWMAASKTT